MVAAHTICLEKSSSIFGISIEMKGFRKDGEISNHFEIVHTGKFSHSVEISFGDHYLTQTCE